MIIFSLDKRQIGLIIFSSLGCGHYFIIHVSKTFILNVVEAVTYVFINLFIVPNKFNDTVFFLWIWATVQSVLPLR